MFCTVTSRPSRNLKLQRNVVGVVFPSAEMVRFSRCCVSFGRNGRFSRCCISFARNGRFSHNPTGFCFPSCFPAHTGTHKRAPFLFSQEFHATLHNYTVTDYACSCLFGLARNESDIVRKTPQHLWTAVRKVGSVA